MALLSRDEIFSHDDHEYAIVPCPEWGGDVRVRSLTAREKDDYDSSLVQIKGDGSSKMNMKDFRVKLVLLAAVDEDGKPLFVPRDLDKLAKKSSRPIIRLAEKIGELSATDDEAIEDAAETFDSAQSDD